MKYRNSNYCSHYILILAGLLSNLNSIIQGFRTASGGCSLLLSAGLNYNAATRFSSTSLFLSSPWSETTTIRTIRKVPPNGFETFVAMRTGVSVDGSGRGASDVVIWAGSGEIYEVFSGKVIAKFEGFDIAKGELLMSDDNNSSSNEQTIAVRQLSRKVFWFRDALTNEILTEYNGEPVTPILYEFQAFEYRKDDNNDDTIVPKIVGSPRELPIMPLTTQRVGEHQMLIQAPVFLDIPSNPPYQAWEIYDYNVDPSFPKDRPPYAVWCRQGLNPPFNTAEDTGRTLMRFIGRRYDQFEDLPVSMKSYVKSNFPLFQEPPQNMEEMKRLVEHKET